MVRGGRIMRKKVFFLILFITLLLTLTGCGKREADFSETKAICELATLKCYYHNTSEIRQEASGIGKWIGNIGYKKAWIEYDGIVKLGVDASKVKIEVEDNIVKVFVPNATILGVDVDVDTISETISKTGWFTKITTEERAEAQKKAQQDMKEKAENNTALLSQATQRAKETIEDYIINVGNLIDVEYEIEWEEVD